MIIHFIGGSSYIGGCNPAYPITYLPGVTGTTSTETMPGGSARSDYIPGVGVGNVGKFATLQSPGGNGAIVLTFISTASPSTSSLLSPTTTVPSATTSILVKTHRDNLNILFWLFFILGIVIFLAHFYRKHWYPVDYLAAFEELQREDNTVTVNGHGEVVSLMSDYGVRAGEDFQELEDRDINLIASKLKKVPRNRFLKYLGRKWSGGDIPSHPVVVADDAITACEVEMSSVNMNKSV